jgi:hypothetical protein
LIFFFFSQKNVLPFFSTVISLFFKNKKIKINCYVNITVLNSKEN